VLTRGDGLTAGDIITRTATAPATTTTSGWASQLVETQNAEFMSLLMPASVYPGLGSSRPAPVVRSCRRHLDPDTFGNADDRGLVRGGRRGHPGPSGRVHQPDLHPEENGGHKLWTREIGEHSTPAIEG
jgi:hypothetical protein